MQISDEPAAPVWPMELRSAAESDDCNQWTCSCAANAKRRYYYY